MKGLGHHARHRSWHLSHCYLFECDVRWRGRTGVRRLRYVIGITKALLHARRQRTVFLRLLDEQGEDLRKRGNEFGAVTGRPRRTGWLDLPLLRYAGMINGISWLVVTKLDVLDHLTEIPVCVGYKINGKETVEIPAQACGYEKIECVYRKMPGWATPTQDIQMLEKLPKAAREYLAFIEKETGARVGMISTGPDREQTILVPDFVSQLGLQPMKSQRLQAKPRGRTGDGW